MINKNIINNSNNHGAAAVPLGNGIGGGVGEGGGGGSSINNENTLFILHRSYFTAYLMAQHHHIVLKLTDCEFDLNPDAPRPSDPPTVCCGMT